MVSVSFLEAPIYLKQGVGKIFLVNERFSW